MPLRTQKASMHIQKLEIVERLDNHQEWEVVGIVFSCLFFHLIFFD